MLRSISVLLSCGVGYFVYAHPYCHYDQREVDVERDLTFCSMDYAPEGVCCTEEETALEETFNAAGDLNAGCADYYKQVLCHWQNEGVCCTEEEETALEETFNAAGDLTCADYYKQVLCGVCGSYSGHLYERLAGDLRTEDGLTMKNEFCTEFTAACDEQIDLPVDGNLEYGEVNYCTMHTGGGEDVFWSYPYEMREQ